jgi:alpha-beta hydrolase superfamily lysophospholipase
MFNPTDFPNATLISVNGVELEVFEAGQHNAGKPIVLCHGWPEHAFSWRYQVPALVEAGYHVIVPISGVMATHPVRPKSQTMTSSI